MEATITSKGQITIPRYIREKLNLQEGDKLHFVVQSDGSIFIVPANRPITNLKGIVPRPAQAITIAEMDEIVLDAGRGGL